MFLHLRRLRVGLHVLIAVLAAAPAFAQEPLDEDRYVAIVLARNPAAAKSRALEAAGAAERKAARLLPDPVFEYTWDRARPADAPDTRQNETSYGVTQVLPWPGTLSAGIDASDRAAEALQARAQSARWELAAEARSAFAVLVAARARASIARDGEEDARTLAELVGRRADLGEARESDRIRATVDRLRQERLRAAADREEASAEARLRALAVDPLPRPLTLVASPRTGTRAIDVAAVSALIADRNPTLRAARAEAERERFRLTAARRGVIPDLIAGFLQQNEIDKKTAGFALGVRLPLWNGNRGEIARAGAAAEAASADAASLAVDISAAVETSVRELQLAAAQAELLETGILPEAERGVGLVRFAYEEGETSLLDLLDVQRTYRETQREAVEARLALALALTGVQRLAGPDFDPWR